MLSWMQAKVGGAKSGNNGPAASGGRRQSTHRVDWTFYGRSVRVIQWEVSLHDTVGGWCTVGSGQLSLLPSAGWEMSSISRASG